MTSWHPDRKPDYDRDQACRIRGCIEPAIGWLQDIPYCADHAEQMLERMQAIALCPSLRETLPEIEHRW